MVLITTFRAGQTDFFEVKHLDLADISGATQFVEIPIAHNDEAWGTCTLVERW